MARYLQHFISFYGTIGFMFNRVPKKKRPTHYRHRVYVQRKVITRDSIGGIDTSWRNTTDAPVWASVTPIKASQREEYRTINVDATHYIRMSARIGVIEDTDRINFDGRRFEILTIEDMQERGIEYFITCKEDR
jgi:SPP1 family predicted phage head-tail adaptor